MAQEEVERRSEAVTSAVVEAIVTSADAQGRQAIAAVAAIAAVSGHSQDRQAAIVATAAGEAIASKTKVIITVVSHWKIVLGSARVFFLSVKPEKSFTEFPL